MMKALTSARSIHLVAVIASNEYPSALSPAQRSFKRRMNPYLGTCIDGVAVIFDDIIAATADQQKHDQIMVKLLQRALEANVKFITAKLQYKVNEVKYMGNQMLRSARHN